MNTIIYLLQVSACTGIFYSFYYLFLRRLTFFTLNRWYLLATLLLSFVIPALTIPVNTMEVSPIMKPVAFVQQMQTMQLPQTVTGHTAADNAEPFDWIALIKNVYIAIAVASTIHLLVTLTLFFRRMSSKKLMQIGNVKILKGGKKLGNSSFLNVIFINDDELGPDEIKQIITHEMLHVKLMHSADRLFARVIQIVLWFNPFAYCYIRSIEENHEFEVDRIVAANDNKGMYAALLFKLAVSGQSYLFHGFSKVPLKKRITMLFNKPTSNMKKIIYLLILPMVLISCLAFANLKLKERISVLGDLSKMGSHPLVLINGKEYKDDILEKISNTSIKSSALFSPPVKVEKYKKHGKKLKDGLVVINTHGLPVSYLTETDKENLTAERSVLQNQFFEKVKQKNADGTEYYKVIFNMPSGGNMSNELGINEKMVFIVDGKTYSELEINKVKQLVTSLKLRTFGTGPAKDYQDKTKTDISGYVIAFNFSNDDISSEINRDTVKYHQKIKLTPAKQKEYDKFKAEQKAYHQTDEYKQKNEALNEAISNTLTYKVTGIRNADKSKQIKEGFTISRNNNEFILTTIYGQPKTLKNLLKVGDEIQIRIFIGSLGKGRPVEIEPAFVIKNGKAIYRMAETAKMPAYAFLYEANKVRFTNGQVTNIKKYPNGKWKSAVVEVVNGYKIKFNLKPNAPDFKNIESGDQVTFRFVHEVKTGTKEYTVNDWVSLSTDIKDYGIKNPDYFYKFYEKG